MKDNFRDPVTIDWKRPYEIGPSDEHLHAIGQFIAIYSNIEWKISELFAHYIKMSEKESREFCAELNLSMAGMIRFVRTRLNTDKSTDNETIADLNHNLGKLERLSKDRNIIVHWQWALSNDVIASVDNLIKPKTISAATYSLEDIRNICLDAVKLLRGVIYCLEIVRGPMTRQQILAANKDTLPEKLLRG
ncbi:TPA: hypothetical protein N2A36_002975 [Pseudomonas aeruginosa]|nr:hypothetical protein [Pseudomonas aeruginosa]